MTAVLRAEGIDVLVGQSGGREDEGERGREGSYVR
jgi:hypothetical protein